MSNIIELRNNEDFIILTAFIECNPPDVVVWRDKRFSKRCIQNTSGPKKYYPSSSVELNVDPDDNGIYKERSCR